MSNVHHNKVSKSKGEGMREASGIEENLCVTPGLVMLPLVVYWWFEMHVACVAIVAVYM